MKNERAQLPDGNCARTLYQSMFDYSSTAACAAARRAMGTRKGEQDA